MRRSILIFAAVFAILFGAAAIYAEVATVEYVEGWVDLRYPDGELVEAFIGDALNRDDAIVTGDDGIATLGNKGAVEITVQPNSVFSLREIDSGGEKETVMHTALGAVSFKFNRLIGKEPRISTPSSVAGVRGTEFTVYAGDEGSTLFTVDSGEVQVVSQGVPVTLYEGEGVEVKAGRAPGAKFTRKGKPIDFATWNTEKQDEFSDDPVSGIRGIERQINNYIREIKSLQAAFDENHILLEKYRTDIKRIKEEKGQEAANLFYKNEMAEVENNESVIFLNIRYFTLSAFSMKRFVVAKQLSLQKAAMLTGTHDSSYGEFISIYDSIIKRFDSEIVPYLGANDI